MTSSVKNNFIAGEWAGGEDAIENINPSDTNDIVGVFAAADESQIEDAVSSACEASVKWGGGGMEMRAELLSAVGGELRARANDIGELISRESGKPLAEGIGEANRAGQFFQYYAAEIFRLSGESIDSVRGGVEIETRREPLGVVAVISPWNFPLATAAWKIAPALAFGNAVVWKPSPLTPAASHIFAEIIARHNFPRGVFNLTMGGADAGKNLAAHKDVDAVSFTGSSATGGGVAKICAMRLAKFQLEMGGKNPLIIMDDADIPLAVECAIAGGYSGSGQKCTASSRLIAHRSIAESFARQLSEELKMRRVGHALDAQTQIGPVISGDKLRENLDYVKLAESEGCKLMFGGEALTRKTQGHFMSPALLVNSKNDMRVNREEMFAPIACIIEVADYDEAVAVANDCDFGLTAGIVTRSLSRACDFRRRSNSGCVMINLPTAGTDYHVPFGGWKKSGFGGAEQGKAAADFYTKFKTAYRRPGAPS